MKSAGRYFHTPRVFPALWRAAKQWKHAISGRERPSLKEGSADYCDGGRFGVPTIREGNCIQAGAGAGRALEIKTTLSPDAIDNGLKILLHTRLVDNASAPKNQIAEVVGCNGISAGAWTSQISVHGSCSLFAP